MTEPVVLVDGDPSKCLSHVLANSNQGDIDDVIATIDKYCWEVEWHMNIGDVKGAFLDRFLLEKKPQKALELGSYLGYSGLRIARLLPPGGKLNTIELNEEHAAIARQVYQHAGVHDRVTLIQGDSRDAIESMRKEAAGKFDFIFIDHWKDVYKRDLILLMEGGLLERGAVIVADNTLYPGCPEYLEYVRGSDKFQSEHFLSKLEYTDREDGLERSVYLGGD